MRYSIVSWYVLREHLVPFVLGLLVLTFILLMNRIFTLIDLIVGKGLAPLVVLQVFVLSLPFILALTVPMAVLVASLMAFGRLAQDSEIVAMKASGIAFWRLTIPVLTAATFLALFMVYFNNHILPESNHQVKNLMIDISQKRPSVKLREMIFIPDFEGYKVFFTRMNARTSRIFGVTVYQEQKNGKPRVISAREGQLRFSGGGSLFTIDLFDGEISDVDKEDPTRSRLLTFDRHTINIPIDTELVRQEREFRSDRELSARAMMTRVENLRTEIDKESEKLSDLQAVALSDSLDPAQDTLAKIDLQIDQTNRRIERRRAEISRYLVEIHKKYSIPFASLAFVLVGAPVAVLARKGGTGMGFGLSTCFFIVYYVALVGGEEVADRRIVSPLIAMWAPNVLLALAGAVMIAHVSLEADWRFWRHLGRQSNRRA